MMLQKLATQDKELCHFEEEWNLLAEEPLADVWSQKLFT